MFKEAIEYGSIDYMRYLVEIYQVPLNCCDLYGTTPLWYSYYSCKKFDFFYYLLQHGADCNLRTGEIGMSDFHRACGWANLDIIQLLLNYGASINQRDNIGKTPLMYSIDFRTNTYYSTQISELLIKNNSNVNEKDMNGLSPLHYACLKGKFDTLKLLLANGADPCTFNNNGNTPITYALIYLNFFTYSKYDKYQRVLIIKELIKKIAQNQLEQSILGEKYQNLVACFDFILYCFNYKSDYLDEAWRFWSKLSISDVRLKSSFNSILKNILFHTSDVKMTIYILQRMSSLDLYETCKNTLHCLTLQEYSNRVNILLLYLLLENHQTQLDSFLNAISLTLTNEFTNPFLKCFLACKFNVNSLKSKCRVIVRQKLGSAIHLRLRDICLPKSLKSFILLPELSDRLLACSTSVDSKLVLDTLNWTKI